MCIYNSLVYINFKLCKTNFRKIFSFLIILLLFTQKTFEINIFKFGTRTNYNIFHFINGIIEFFQLHLIFFLFLLNFSFKMKLAFILGAHFSLTLYIHIYKMTELCICMNVDKYSQLISLLLFPLVWATIFV